MGEVNEINLAKAKRFLKKVDQYNNTINTPSYTVEAAWNKIEYIQNTRADIVKLAELDGIPADKLIAECSNNVRIDVCLRLFKLTKPEDATRFAIDQLNSDIHSILDSAVDLLKTIKSEKSKSALEEYCRKLNKEEDEYRFELAHRALAEFSYDETPGYVIELLDESPVIALSALSNIPSIEATNILLTYLDDKDNSLRLEALKGLKERNEEDVFSTLIDYLAAGKAQTKLDAIDLLSEFKSDNACLAVCAVMKSGKSIKLRQQAALSLGKINNKLAIEFLMESLQNQDEHPDVIARVCFSLKKLDVKEAIPVIFKIIINESFGEGKVKLLNESSLYTVAVDALHSLEGNKNNELFIELLGHRLVLVRLKAIHALRQRKTESSYTALVDRLQIEEDADCKRELEKSIKMLSKYKPG